MKKLFLPLVALGLMTACSTTTENNAEKTEVKSMVDDHDGHDHDGHDHDHDHGSAMSGPEIPAVPAGSKVFFANLNDGDEVSSEVYVEFGAEGIEVEPAGLVKEGFGHHHIIINDAATPFGEAVPANETHIHYGGGEKGDTLNLPVGTHTLVLQFADGLHRSYGEQLSASIQVKVVE